MIARAGRWAKKQATPAEKYARDAIPGTTMVVKVSVVM
jgi:hypothetical protein